ncbi:GNAT family N-acetyltransferase [Spongiimicrobium sp. 3-5]|uniref:GNAT family N-acetyltransferase n=1 Tax=Spongiimicrobium sp. 3-5 TaxID=3332596 RepID=UPI003980CFC0
MKLQLHKCTSEDLGQLMDISRKTFIDAFEKDNDPEDFESYMDEAFGHNSLVAQLSDTESHFYFVHNSDDLVGYFKLNEGNAQTEVKQAESIELERIYVCQEFQGKRIGEWALEEVKKLAREAGKTFLWLGVWEKNLKAIKFYERHGFSKFGTHPYYIGKDKQTDWLMRFNLVNLDR